jgi:hypothetical protein
MQNNLKIATEYEVEEKDYELYSEIQDWVNDHDTNNDEFIRTVSEWQIREDGTIQYAFKAVGQGKAIDLNEQEACEFNSTGLKAQVKQFFN